MSVTVHTGDARLILGRLETASVHCIVTSPPYWGLRNYGGGAVEIGAEETLGEHLEALVRVFASCWRVLRDDGTLWLNYGDAYAVAGGTRHRQSPSLQAIEPASRLGTSGNKGNVGADHPCRVLAGGYVKPKDKLLMPHQVAIRLQEAGWYVRQDIVWSKKNPMPESVLDRPSTGHEYLFLLSKSQRYHYDAAAVRRPLQPESLARLMQPTFDTQTGGPKDPGTGNRSARRALENLSQRVRATDKQRGYGRRHAGFNDRWDAMSKAEQEAFGANLRSVWELATKPYPGAHFAVMPPELVEPCILAGCPEGGTVLDPFAGAGTVGLVAARLQRNAVLIELNPEYADMARRRINDDAPLLAGD